jgi:hypothetical protein
VHDKRDRRLVLSRGEWRAIRGRDGALTLSTRVTVINVDPAILFRKMMRKEDLHCRDRATFHENEYLHNQHKLEYIVGGRIVYPHRRLHFIG